jgi:hypothetical protein
MVGSSGNTNMLLLARNAPLWIGLLLFGHYKGLWCGWPVNRRIVAK